MILTDNDVDIPPLTLSKLKDILFRKLKPNKACDVYMLTTEHLRFSGDKSLQILCDLINRLLKDLYLFIYLFS